MLNKQTFNEAKSLYQNERSKSNQVKYGFLKCTKE